MSDIRDRKVNDRLEKMSGLFEHSEKKEKPVAKLDAQQDKKNDILNELPAEIRFKALQNGMSLEELRDLYAEVKVEYTAKKFDYQSSLRTENKERRNDNVRERILEEERERQNDQVNTRGKRSYERSRSRSRI